MAKVTQIRKFATGDLAVLKSGGPPMSVAAIADYDNDFGAEMIQCIWFGPEESLCSAAFPSTVLVKVIDES